MQTNESVQGDLRRWLLGLLSEQDSHSLEERLITDAEFYEELHIVEDELIDDYLAGGLTVSERKAFESYFMNSPERQEQFRIANALRVYIEDSKLDVSDTAKAPHLSTFGTAKPVGSFWQSFRKTIVPVSVLAAAVLVVFVWWTLSLRSPSQSNSLSVVLTSGGQTREGGSIQTVRVPPDIEFLQLHLRMSRNDFQKYRVILVNSAGDIVQTNENLTPLSDVAGPTIQLSVRTSKTPRGEYRVKLDGIEDGKFESADTYRFVIITP